MKSTIEVKTGIKNHYLYDIKLKELLISHPIINFLWSVFKKGNQIKNLEELEYLLNSQTGLKKDTFSFSDLQYYFAKFHFLESHGFFSDIDYERLLRGRLSKYSVEAQVDRIHNIVFEVTDRCNLKCKYCTYGELYDNYDERTNKLMSFNSIKTLIDFLHTKWKNHLESTSHRLVNIGFYGGEPLLNMKVIKRTVEYIKGLEEVKRTFVFRMTTNAILLDKYMDYLVENEFQLLVSLDGNQNNHSYRVLKNGKNSFDIVFNNLKKMRQAHPVYFEKNISFNSVLHNKNSIEEIHNFIFTEFGKVPQINVVSGDGIRMDKREDFYDLFKNIYSDYAIITDKRELIEKRFISDINVFRLALFLRWKLNIAYEKYNELTYGKVERVRCPTGSCLPFGKKIFLTVNDKILACERISQKFELGKIINNKVEIDFQKIAEMYNGYYDIFQKQCKKCYDADSCIQCMFQLGEPEGIIECPNFITEQIYSNMISQDISTLENFPHMFAKILNEVILK